MAHLLGSKFCLESLQHDIKDVEEIVNEIASRVGVVKTQSWKFPDKQSSEVDVGSFLTDCSYQDEEEEDNQVAHVMLYDLLIDRLVFTLQSFARYNELLLASENHVVTPSGKSASSISAGLSAKRCWSRISQVATVMQQLAKEVQRKTRALDKEELKMSLLEQSSTENLRSQATPAATQDSSSTVSYEAANRGSQTAVTAYSSCETCARSQACLHDVGKAVVKVCKSQGLPTALEDYIEKQSDTSLMSIAEVTRWKNLQTKDLSRVDRQLDSLMRQIKPLKDELSATTKKEGEAKAEVQRLHVIAERREKEFVEEQRVRQYQLKETLKATENELDHFKRMNEKMSEESTQLKDQLSQLKDELLTKHREFVQAENERAMLREESKENRQYQKDSIRLQSELSEVKRNLQETEEKVLFVNEQLKREIMKNTTLSSHEQAMQEKQSGLLKRLDELDEECEDLRERLCMAEEERDQAEDKMKEEEQKSESLIKTVTSKDELSSMLHMDKETLERRADDLAAINENLESQLSEYIERERLLVAYPDLHTSAAGMPESCGDVFMDMQRQVEANQIRIQVLEKENQSLRKTLASVTSTTSNGSFHETSKEQLYNDNPIQPVQLWNTSRDIDQVSHTTSSISGSSIRLGSKVERSRRSPVPSYLSDKSNRSNVMEAYNHSKQQNTVSPVRQSFHIGPGKQRSRTPTTSTPNSGRSALLKPWT